MGELTIMPDGTLALSGPHRSDPALSGSLGWHVFISAWISARPTIRPRSR
jgi:hypothetical protein